MHIARCVLPFVTLAALACSGAGEPRPAAHSEVAETTPEEPVDPAEPIDPDSTCGRAQRCCHAFAAHMPNVNEAALCSGIAEALATPQPDARCRAMMAGWHEALEHLPEADATPCL